MDNLDDSENNPKISDSAYSNSCSNSQSRSHSSKSTHSGSSESSGYGGKPSTSGSSNKLEQTSKKDKDVKKRKVAHLEAKELPAVVDCGPQEPVPHRDEPKEELNNVIETSSPLALPENAVENVDTAASELTPPKHEMHTEISQTSTESLDTSCQVANGDSNGFSCAISIHDGVVMYASQDLTANLGFPKDMWIGRPFIDFVHPNDRSTFASQITDNRTNVPTTVDMNSVGTATAAAITNCARVCRIRRYRGLNDGFGIKENVVIYIPFLLKFYSKDIHEDDGKMIYLIIQASPVYSCYKKPNECVVNAIPFVIKHTATGLLKYIDVQSVPYLGYLPQDVYNQDALLLYHPDDLPYLKIIYETIVKEGKVSESMPYRMLANNGEYVKLKTEWSSFINPWSMKLEFVIGKHHVLEGPTTPDVFSSPSPKQDMATDEEKVKTQLDDENRRSILKILKEALTEPAEKAKQRMNKRCQELALFMETMLKNQPKPEVASQDTNPAFDRDLVILGGVSPHHDNDSKSSTGTPLSYNQLNFNENLQRYFESHRNFCFDEKSPQANHSDSAQQPSSRICLSPMAQNSVESNDMSGFGSPNTLLSNKLSPPRPMETFNAMRLTESLLTKHNTDMEKKLVKYHRESRTTSKADRTTDSLQKKKEHLARCNATFQPTMAGATFARAQYGVKRALSTFGDVTSKQQCTASRQFNRHINSVTENKPTATTTATGTQWQNVMATGQALIGNYFTMGVQPQIPVVSNITDSYTMYYPTEMDTGASFMVRNPMLPLISQPQSTQSLMVPILSHQMTPYPNTAIPWSYPQQFYGTPYAYSQVPYTMQQQPSPITTPPPMSCSSSINTLGLLNSNYIQVSKPTPTVETSLPVVPATWMDIKSETEVPTLSMYSPSCGNTSTIAFGQDSEPWPKAQQIECKATPKPENFTHITDTDPSTQSGLNSDEVMDKTDEESSYSSFYSSFLKTDSGSCTDSTDRRKNLIEFQRSPTPSTSSFFKSEPYGTNIIKRKADPQPSMDPELIFRYQIKLRPEKEVLAEDLEKIKKLEQPALVNEQLKQLYLDLHLQGVASRLTLEEGITSSSSSGEESLFGIPGPMTNRKREYNKLSMIYEENAPIPPATETKDNPVSQASA